MFRWNQIAFIKTITIFFSGGSARASGTVAHSESMARVVAHQVILFVALLLIGIQLIIFIVIDHAISINARQKISGELRVGERIFLRLLDGRSQQLVVAAKILVSDFAFRKAIMTGDKGTIESALSNYASRIDASKMILVAPDNKVLADASVSGGVPSGSLFAFTDLVKEAAEYGHASAIKLIGGMPYQLVVVPVLVPAPVGWVVLGFSIDSRLAAELESLTSLEVSFAVWKKRGGWHIVSSNTLPEANQRLLSVLEKTLQESAVHSIQNLSRDDYVTSASTLTAEHDGKVVAILQRSIEGDIARFNTMRMTMLALATLSLAGTIVGSILIARSISRPVTALVDFARRLERGDYEQALPETNSDEFRELASAFNNMRLAISAREQQIKTMAYHDTLTGLPNRALFNDRLHQAIGIAKRLNHPVSVMLIDLNRFKEVNDTLGHHVGDFLLCEVGVRLQAVLTRVSDTSARLGGDEFAVILPAATAKMAEEVARNILRSLEEPCVFEKRLLDIEGSIGIATFPEHGADQHMLMSRADVAMYHAKRKFLGCMVYDDGLNTSFEKDSQFSLLGELRHAVERNEFVLYYQPRINLIASHSDEVEALIRWEHPVRGFLPPSEFIPFAEQTGFIREITYWVMDAALAQSVRWRARGLAVIISINLSVRDLLSAGLATRIGELVQRHEASPDWFRLEITESVIMDNPERVFDTVRQLNEMGFSLSIDDFGTGYSSLAWIKKLHVRELKIDRSFVVNMVSDAEDMIIVRAIIDLAHNMGLLVVAEGVESAKTLELLGEMMCDVAQGYHICRPVPIDQLEIWLMHHQNAARIA